MSPAVVVIVARGQGVASTPRSLLRRHWVVLLVVLLVVMWMMLMWMMLMLRMRMMRMVVRMVMIMMLMLMRMMVILYCFALFGTPISPAAILVF